MTSRRRARRNKANSKAQGTESKQNKSTNVDDSEKFQKIDDTVRTESSTELNNNFIKINKINNNYNWDYNNYNYNCNSEDTRERNRKLNKKIFRVVVGFVIAVAMIAPIILLSVQSFYKPQMPYVTKMSNLNNLNKIANDNNAKITVSSNMTRKQRLEILKKYPNLVHSDADKERFLKTGIIPKPVK